MKKQTQINGLLSPLLQKIRFNNIKPFINGKVCLDIGCSNGELRKHLHDDMIYIGIEGNKTYCDRAKVLYPDCEFINSYLNETKVKNLKISKKIECIVASAFIEHLDDPVIVLTGLKKYLKKDGRVIITTPSKFSEWILNYGSKVKLFSKEGAEEHKKQYTKKELFELSKKSGYNVIHYHAFEFGLNHLIVLEKNED